MTIQGNLEAVLTNKHVARVIERKGYAPVIDAALREMHYLSAEGTPWLLRQARSSYGSWTLWVDGSPIVRLRVLRPYNGALHVESSSGACSGVWDSPEAVRDWFQQARLRALAVAP